HRKVKKVEAPQIEVTALAELEQINLHAAGIDVGSEENYVALPGHCLKPEEPAVRVFGVFNEDLDATVQCLKDYGITTVAMEATGIYWLALYDKLELAGVETTVCR